MRSKGYSRKYETYHDEDANDSMGEKKAIARIYWKCGWVIMPIE